MDKEHVSDTELLALAALVNYEAAQIHGAVACHGDRYLAQPDCKAKQALAAALKLRGWEG